MCRGAGFSVSGQYGSWSWDLWPRVRGAPRTVQLFGFATPWGVHSKSWGLQFSHYRVLIQDVYVVFSLSERMQGWVKAAISGKYEYWVKPYTSSYYWAFQWQKHHKEKQHWLVMVPPPTSTLGNLGIWGLLGYSNSPITKQINHAMQI